MQVIDVEIRRNSKLIDCFQDLTDLGIRKLSIYGALTGRAYGGGWINIQLSARFRRQVAIDFAAKVKGHSDTKYRVRRIVSLYDKLSNYPIYGKSYIVENGVSIECADNELHNYKRHVNKAYKWLSHTDEKPVPTDGYDASFSDRGRTVNKKLIVILMQENNIQEVYHTQTNEWYTMKDLITD